MGERWNDGTGFLTSLESDLLAFTTDTRDTSKREEEEEEEEEDD